MITASMSVASRPDALAIPTADVAASGSAAKVQASKPNPSSQLDLTLGITVLTFHDASGQVVATTPTQQQLNTYLLFGSSEHPSQRSAASAGGATLELAEVRRRRTAGQGVDGLAQGRELRHGTPP